ncbi:MAG: DNA-binding response regulator [Chloroflexi bacterium HGW-Chloroflexi-4]|jgi:DNA-binding response OmpR family regulator|nr:MAG: DNA-binding response regulator [Chloroflexi bacterium HGW-Chloroflexi-4]
MKKILVIDDDTLMRRSMAFNLEQAGYKAFTAANAEDGLEIVRKTPPDLVLLDIGLPEMDGLDAIKQIKSISPIPVIFVTARRRELDEVVGLELGADDYITKPFDNDVLLAHIKAVLRRSIPAAEITTSNPIQAGALYMDPITHTAKLADKNLELSPREFDLLYLLARDRNQVKSTTEILAQVWGAEYYGEPQVVYVHIRWLRQKLELDPNHPKLILTVRGVGYKFSGGE